MRVGLRVVKRVMTRTTGEILLVIDREPPPTYNAVRSMHWADQYKLKELWKNEVALAALKARRPRFKRARVQIVLLYAQRRRRDPDNLMAVAGKYLLDGLRYAGVIPDDDVATVEVPEIVVEIDKANPRVEITLTELI